MASVIINIDEYDEVITRFNCPFCNSPHTHLRTKNKIKVGDIISLPATPCIKRHEYNIREFLGRITQNTINKMKWTSQIVQQFSKDDD